MDVTSFLPINTKEKVDEIINLIQSNQEPKSIYTDILVYIQKVKIQLYFKEEFDHIKGRLPYKKETVQISRNSSTPYNYKNKKEAERTIEIAKKGTIVIKDKIVGVHLFRGMTVKQLSDFLDIPTTILLSIIKQKNKSVMDLSENYILTEIILTPCLDFLQNAYNIKIRKDKKQTLLEKEIATAGYYRKKMEDRFKPSLGQEGNYRKLIYIRTKT